jgi:hypothetical protein
MWARIASFEGGNTEELQRRSEERMASGEANLPQGMKRALVFADAGANRRLFISFFDSREAIAAAEERFEAMGDELPEEIRGRRTAVDVYEVVYDESL